MGNEKTFGQALWNWLLEQANAKKPQFSDARMTVEEVKEKANLVATEEGWLEDLEPNEPMLYSRRGKKKKLTWGVYFSLKGQFYANFAAHARIEIDDATGEVLRKHYADHCADH
jgi:hypothetical protein